jgi:twitching motility protein PilT
MAQVDKFLNFLVKNSGSDLHLVTGSPPIVRIDGLLQKMKLPPLTGDQVKSLIFEIIPERNRKEYEAINDTDFAYQIENVARFRTNVYRDIRGPAMAQRLIPFDIMTVDDLGLPQLIRDLVMLPNQNHGYGSASSYMMRRRWDYFVKWLLGVEPPKEYQMQQTPGR